MNKKRIIYIAVSAALYICFALFTRTLLHSDVQAIGPNGSAVGYASFNGKCLEAFGSSSLMADVTKALGWLSILICAVFGLIGLLQLIRAKSLRGVDRDIICMGVLYALAIGFYLAFNKIVINFRPVLEADGTLEASYPSSHTVLAVVVFASLIIEISRRVTDRGKALVEEISCLAIIFIAVFGRLLSGVHWATDIFGGVLLSLALVFSFLAMLPERRGCER